MVVINSSQATLWDGEISRDTVLNRRSSFDVDLNFSLLFVCDVLTHLSAISFKSLVSLTCS